MHTYIVSLMLLKISSWFVARNYSLWNRVEIDGSMIFIEMSSSTDWKFLTKHKSDQNECYGCCDCTIWHLFGYSRTNARNTENCNISNYQHYYIMVHPMLCSKQTYIHAPAESMHFNSVAYQQHPLSLLLLPLLMPHSIALYLALLKCKAKFYYCDFRCRWRRRRCTKMHEAWCNNTCIDSYIKCVQLNFCV